LPPESSIAVETVGNWYWMVDETQQAGHQPRLAHARKAKLMMATLLRNGTLPEVWIPSREIRDQRELLRLRMTLVGIETRLKNRVHAILAKYALRFEVADVFSQKGRRLVLEHLEGLPEETRRVVRQHLELLESTERQKKVTEQRLQAIVQQRDDVELLRTLPGVGWILATVLALEIGDIQRFNHAPELASYAGTVPARPLPVEERLDTGESIRM
jgi:transposase